jgi:hypothetical protein
VRIPSLVLLTFLTIARAHAAGDSRLERCERAWDQVYAGTENPDAVQNNADLLKRWQAFEGECKGTGVYEVRLAALYSAMHQTRLAITVLDGIKNLPPQYEGMVKLLHLRVKVTVLTDERPYPRDKILALRPQFEKFAANYPDWYLAAEQASNYMSIIDDKSAAITYALRSLELRQDQWEPNRTLALAYMELGDYDKAIRAARRAQELHNAVISDPPFMYAVSKSYAAIGNITVAKMTLAMLQHERPMESGTPDWNDAIGFIVKQIKAGNVRN